MSAWLVYALFFCLVIATHLLEGITGFGSTALSMPFLSLLMGISVAKPVLTLYTLLLCLYILAQSIRHVDWKNLGKMMVALLLGLPLGILLYTRLPKNLLLWLLAGFMILVSVRGLLLSFGVLKRKEIPTRLSLFLVFLGGIMHGAFSSGGPLIIIHATEKMPEKGTFRATMCMVWLTLNTLLLIQMALSAQLTLAVWKPALLGLPALAIGTLWGNWAHKRIHAALFTKLTFCILLASGLFMAASLL